MSSEPADTEDAFRRSFFVDLNRQEVIEHYKRQFDYLPILRLNYPPEDAQTIIRDQTRSVYLEELTHPFRESIYINGFVPQVAKDDIWYKGVHYEQKITVKYVQSSRIVRMFIAVLTLIVSAWLIKEFSVDIRNVRKS